MLGRLASVADSASSRLGTAGEVLAFLWRRKLWWLVPMVVLLFVFGVLLLLTQTAEIAPFIYTLF